MVLETHIWVERCQYGGDQPVVLVSSMALVRIMHTCLIHLMYQNHAEGYGLS